MTRITFLLFTAAAALMAQNKPVPATVSPGKYHCVFFTSGALQTTPGFTISVDGTYQHDSGSKGRYTYNKGLLEFQGGSLDKQAGKVEVNEKSAIVRLYNERRSRTVIDCDVPRK